MPLTLAVQSLQTLSRSGESSGNDLNAQLNAGRTLSASVKEVVMDPQRPNLFRIKVEAQNMLMELVTSRPLDIGAQVTLSRSGEGPVLLSLAGQTTAQQTKSAQQQPLPLPQPTAPRAEGSGPGLQLRIPLDQLQSEALQRALPLNQPQSGRVLPSVITSVVTPQLQATGQPTQQPANQPMPANGTAPSTQPTSVTTPTAASAPSATATAQTAVQIPAQSASGQPQATTSVQTATPTAQPATTVTAPSTPAPPSPAPVAAGQTTANPAPPADASSTAQTVQAATAGSATTNPAQTTPATPLLQTQQTAASPPPTNNVAAAPVAATSTANQIPAPASATSGAATPPPAGTTQAGPPTPTQPAPTQQSIQSEVGNAQSRVNVQASTPAERPSISTATAAMRGAAMSEAAAKDVTNTSAAANPSPVAKSGPNPVQISVNGQRIELLTPRPLQAGLTLQLTRTDQNSVLVEILPPKVDPGAQARLQEGLQQILKDSLPQQLPMADALNQLRQISRGEGGRQQDAIGQVVRSMLSLFSVSSKPDPGSTRQAVEQQLQASGLIREQKGTQPMGEQRSSGLKEQLGRLDQLSERLPTEARERLQSLMQGIQARTATHQAASLQHWQDLPDGSIERQYRLDLPIRLNDQQLDNTEIRITQHKRRDEQDRFVSEWSINLHFNLQELGAIDSRISLQQDWHLSARFWAERSDTTQLIRDRLEGFAEQLGRSGFDIDTLHVQQGRQPRETQPSLSRRLVDLHT